MNFKEQYFDAWQEAWRFHKKFYDNDGSDQTWDQIVDASGEIVKEYDSKQTYGFVKDLVLAVLGELERMDKHKRKESEKVG